jgi:hypothetical protein
VDKELLDEYRRAYSQWEDQVGNAVHPLVRLGGRMRDAMVVVDTAMVAESGQLDAWPATVAWVADDTETCVFCAWPESSAVVLRIGDSNACETHIWTGLLSKLGPHPREGFYFDAQA